MKDKPYVLFLTLGSTVNIMAVVRICLCLYVVSFIDFFLDYCDGFYYIFYTMANAIFK